MKREQVEERRGWEGREAGERSGGDTSLYYTGEQHALQPSLPTAAKEVSPASPFPMLTLGANIGRPCESHFILLLYYLFAFSLYLWRNTRRDYKRQCG